MTNRIPRDAFALYVSMGLERSYQRVADAFSVSKRAVVKAATRENWTGRLKRIEERNREKLDEKLSEDISEMKERHLKMLRAVGGRAVKALQEYPLTSGMAGIKALEIVIRLERLMAGESAERESDVIAKTTKQEIDRLLSIGSGPAATDDGEDLSEAEDW